MADPTLGLADYAVGLLWLFVVGVALASSAVGVARAALPAGPIRAVAGAVVALVQVTLTAQVLGAVGALHPLAFAVVTGVGSLAVRVLGPRPSTASSGARPPTPAGTRREPVWETVTGIGSVSLVVAQWVSHAVDALQRGMTHPDTLWYHGPFSARFLQTGSLGELDQLGYLRARYYPLGSELLHTVVALPFHRDLLSPLVNLWFLGLALVSAWAIGRQWGAGALAATACAVGAALPTLAGTQPGQASNDMAVVALFLAAVAIVLHVEPRPLPLALAGAALGLAVGTKVTIVAMACVLLVALGLPLVRSRAWASVAGLGLGAVAPAAAWPLRNLILVGHPVPFWDVSIGPLRLDRVAPADDAPSVLRDPLAGSEWSYVGGLRNGFGPAWWLALALLVAGPLLVAVRGPRPLRPVAAAVLAGAAAYTVTPVTGAGSFQFNLRYLTPALVGGLVLAAAGAAGRRWARLAVGGALTSLLLAALTADHHERVAAWPGSIARSVAVVAAVAMALAAATVTARAPSRVARSVAGLAVGLVAMAGWFVQQHHFEQRYVAAGLHDDVLNAAFRTVRDEHVDVVGTRESYPFFGGDLSNEVRDWSEEMSFGAPMPTDPCRVWRARLHAPGWVVVSTFGFAMVHLDEATRDVVFAADPASSVRLQDAERAIYRLEEPLDPEGCP